MFTINDLTKTSTGYTLTVPSLTVNKPTLCFNLTNKNDGIVVVSYTNNSMNYAINCMSLSSALACITDIVRKHSNYIKF